MTGKLQTATQNGNADYRQAVRRGTYTDCHALSHYADWVAQYAEPSMFVDAFKVFYADKYGGYGEGVYLEGSRSGYRSEYQDQVQPNADQAHHFALFFVQGAGLAASDPETAAAIITGGALALEVGNMFRDLKFNANDVRLGISAGMMGYSVARGIAAGRTDAAYGPGEPGSRDLGSMIRKELCK